MNQAVPRRANDGPDRIEFLHHFLDDGRKLVFVAAPWPAEVYIPPQFIAEANQPGSRIFRSGGDIMIRCDNGHALYRKATGEADGTWICRLIQHSYRPSPVRPG